MNLSARQDPPSRFVSVKEFCARTTLSRGHVYYMIANGQLEKPARITERRVGWPAEQVERWIAERVNPASHGASEEGIVA